MTHANLPVDTLRAREIRRARHLDKMAAQAFRAAEYAVMRRIEQAEERARVERVDQLEDWKRAQVTPW